MGEAGMQQQPSGKLKIFLLDLFGLFENKPNKPL
jgi:hypothetical protein